MKRDRELSTHRDYKETQPPGIFTDFFLKSYAARSVSFADPQRATQNYSIGGNVPPPTVYVPATVPRTQKDQKGKKSRSVDVDYMVQRWRMPQAIS